MMCELNYNDLLYLVVEYDIAEVKKYWREMEQHRLAGRGQEVIKASNNTILNMHGKGGVKNGN
jgi:hypothetical protein